MALALEGEVPPRHENIRRRLVRLLKLTRGFILKKEILTP
jgi:hypothetical protein